MQRKCRFFKAKVVILFLVVLLELTLLTPELIRASAAETNQTQSDAEALSEMLSITVRDVTEPSTITKNDFGCWLWFGKRQTFEIQVCYDFSALTDNQDIRMRLLENRKFGWIDGLLYDKPLLTAEIYGLDGKVIYNGDSWAYNIFSWHSVELVRNESPTLYNADYPEGKMLDDALFSSTGAVIEQGSVECKGTLVWTVTEAPYASFVQALIVIIEIVIGLFVLFCIYFYMKSYLE